MYHFKNLTYLFIMRWNILNFNVGIFYFLILEHLQDSLYFISTLSLFQQLFIYWKSNTLQHYFLFYLYFYYFILTFFFSPHFLPPPSIHRNQRKPPPQTATGQSPRSTSKPTTSKSKTPETHAQAETHEAHTACWDPRSRDRRWERQWWQGCIWRERRREGKKRKKKN